jgi:putative ABC transport system permease protein
MSWLRLLLLNVVSHWRGNLAVLLSVAVGTAVLTGALLVGDSLRGSLRDLALEQLGWVEQALIAPRLLHADLAKVLPAKKVCPAILLAGSAVKEVAGSPRADKITILAVDDRFWPADQAPLDAEFWRSHDKSVVVNHLLAERLSLKVGERLTLHVESPSAVPRESLLGQRDTERVLSRMEVTVAAVLPDSGMGRFTLRPSPSPALNAFVPLRLVQDRYDPDTKKAPFKGRANTFLVGGAETALAAPLHANLTLDDWGLVLRTPAERGRDWAALLAGRAEGEGEGEGEGAANQAGAWDGKLRSFRWKGRVPEALERKADAQGILTREALAAYVSAHHGYLSLESPQMFLDAAALKAAVEVAKSRKWAVATSLVYLVDTLDYGAGQLPYLTAAALDPRFPEPLGPIQPLNRPPLQDDEILLARWPGSPSDLQLGQAVKLRYYVPGSTGQLRLEHKELRFAGWYELTGPADDADLTPRFEGITNKLDILQWENPPFPFDRRRLKPADSEFWKRYRTTPKAIVTLATGQKLWGSRYGDATSLRIVPTPAEDFETAAAEFRRALLRELKPQESGLAFNDVRLQALGAGAGSNDFGMLFLGFSSFLIVAALLLVGLMVRLNLDHRAREIGLLLAVGWRRAQVRRLVLAEGAFLAVGGGLVGAAGGVGFAGGLLAYMGRLWPGGLERALLRLHVETSSCIIGWTSSVAISLLTIALATRVLARLPACTLLAGGTLPNTAAPARRGRIGYWVAGGLLLGALGLGAIGAVSHGQEAQAGSFFGCGTLVLAALLTLLWARMKQPARPGHVASSLTTLGGRNAARHPVRSLLTAGLLASATFLVVAVQAFHRDAGRDFLAKSGGSGGYAWIGESSLPIFQDLNEPATQSDWRLPAGAGELHFVPFRVRPGDDASCLNLYKPLQPRILGAPRALADRGGFHFAAVEGDADAWKLLNESRADGAIPAIGEANTVRWMLKSDIGEEITVKDDRGRPVRLRIVALLEDSVFQSELLIADASFVQLYPREEGFRFFLIDAPPPSKGVGVRQAVETALADYGFAMTPAAERLQSFLDVENTYLATFQALGGLGLLLGTLGLAVVLLRSVWERRGELALMRALGFRRSALGWLVLAENAYLLLCGLLIGILAALAAIAPVGALTGGELLGPGLLGLLGLVLGIGLTCGALATWSTLRAPLLTALRRD